MGKYEKIYECEKNADVLEWRVRIWQLMNKNRITQQELASGCDIAPSVISDWIGTNKTSNVKLREPTIMRFQKIADFFGVSMDYLMGRNHCPTPDDEKIHEVTGLSAGAIQQLKKLNNSVDTTDEKRLCILNYLLENMEKTELFENLYDYLLGDFVFPGREDDMGAAYMVSRLNNGRQERMLVFREVFSQAIFVNVQSDLMALKEKAKKKQEASHK